MTISVPIIKTGSTFPELAAQRGDFEDWIRHGLGMDEVETPAIDVRLGEGLPELGDAGDTQIDGIVITGSHSMVTEQASWSETTAQWLKTALDEGIPILGICYGHQLLAHAAGGQVGSLPELGRVDATLTDEAHTDPLFSGLPPTFGTLNGHFEGVLALPDQAVALATTPLDQYHIFRIGDCAWGVQFHPEFDADIVRAYLANGRDELTGLGIDPDEIMATLDETPTASSILTRFATYIRTIGDVKIDSGGY